MNEGVNKHLGKGKPSKTFLIALFERSITVKFFVIL
jgi:hypothetical protein